MRGLTPPVDDNVLVGLDPPDDAGVYRVSDDLALIQTVDFFTPVVDDPYWFGRIAAANALSDVYAMGGVPKTAMNLVGFPRGRLDLAVLRHILSGGLDQLREAGVALVGGHSVEDPELKYGLSVTGFIHPDRILAKGGMRPGDRLVLTKPIGTGVVNTAVKAGMAGPDLVERVTRLMDRLNRDAAAIMSRYPVHACTDVTGFGLLGHLAEMVTASDLGVRLEAARVPVIPECRELAAMGLLPAGAHRNREFRECLVDAAPGVERVLVHLLFDPQTSGGLLISVAPEAAESLAAEIRDHGDPDAAVIGKVMSAPPGRIRLE